jgi:hypothetical protein
MSSSVGRGPASVEWQKSSRSGSSACVEVALVNGMIAVHDSKDPQGPILSYTGAEWLAFIEGVKLGEFDGFAGRD